MSKLIIISQFTCCNFKEETEKMTCTVMKAPLFNIRLHPLWQRWLPPRFLQASITFLHVSAAIFFHSSFAVCSSSGMFAGFLYPVEDLSTPCRFSTGLKSRFITGQFKTVLFFPFSTIPAYFWMCSWVFILLEKPWSSTQASFLTLSYIIHTYLWTPRATWKYFCWQK